MRELIENSQTKREVAASKAPREKAWEEGTAGGSMDVLILLICNVPPLSNSTSGLAEDAFQ
jgi:hypothetical protein